ncbi:MAG: hypothetical protein M1813_006604 [Trichoglossum hirsutum]|nr:MAG: hypothetical protein M1813_006604 [Trichoglossum hirsutum]
MFTNLTKVNHWEPPFDDYMGNGEVERPFLDNPLFPEGKTFSRTIQLNMKNSSGGGLTQYGLWTDVIQDYSGRNLTLQEDRLPVLAGIASELAKLWDYAYLAAPCMEISKPYQSKATYQSPGWSWITADFKVWVEAYFDFDCAEVLDASVELRRTDFPFGGMLSS